MCFFKKQKPEAKEAAPQPKERESKEPPHYLSMGGSAFELGGRHGTINLLNAEQHIAFADKLKSVGPIPFEGYEYEPTIIIFRRGRKL